MTDLEITKLCAEAMGFECRVQEKSQHYAEGVFITKYGEDYFKYDPIHDDVQAMALLKRFPIDCLNAMCREGSADFNRTICEAVANMQKSKG